MGVRISWLMVARNWDFARFAVWAASMLSRSSAVRVSTSFSSSSRWRARRSSRFWISLSMELKLSMRRPTSSWPVFSARRP